MLPARLSRSCLAVAAAAAFVALPAAAKDTFVSNDIWGRLTIAADAHVPGRLAIGGQVDSCASRMGGHLSTDAGASWQTRCLPGVEYSAQVDAPTVAFDAAGNLLAVGTVVDDADYRSLHATRSSDGGQTWTPWAYVISAGRGGVGSSRLKVDGQPGSAFKGSHYVSYTLTGSEPFTSQVVVSRSRDGGAHWDSAGASPEGPEGVNYGQGDLAIGRRGQLYASYLVCEGFNCVGQPAKVQVVRSGDGGVSWSAPIDVATVQLPTGAGYWGGLPRTQSSLSFMPAIAVDTSQGPGQGDVHLATTTFADGRLQVLTARSQDGGRHWSALRPVSVGQGDQFLPAISVDAQGTVAVTWLDRRNDPERIRYQPMVAFSTDGGSSFGEPRVLDHQLTDPRKHYAMDESADHVVSGHRVQMVFLGKDRGTDMTVRINSAKP